MSKNFKISINRSKVREIKIVTIENNKQAKR